MENVITVFSIKYRHIDVLEDALTLGARISSLCLYSTSKSDYRVNGTSVLFYLNSSLANPYWYSSSSFFSLSYYATSNVEYWRSTHPSVSFSFHSSNQVYYRMLFLVVSSSISTQLRLLLLRMKWQ